MADLLAQIRATPWLAELLADQFEFDLTRDDPVEEVQLPSGDPLTPIAGDGAGGTFLLAPSGAVVYAGSEGEGGLIASTLRDALALIVGLPSLHDALARPLGDGLRNWLSELDEEIRQDDGQRGFGWLPLDEARTKVRQALDLPHGYDLIAQLHEAAADERFRPVSEHGLYAPMLGT